MEVNYSFTLACMATENMQTLQILVQSLSLLSVIISSPIFTV